MNQKDYKTIAEIINRNSSINFIGGIEMIEELADYFEKESFERGKTKFDLKMELNPKDIFNKKQFLKDAGDEQ